MAKEKNLYDALGADPKDSRAKLKKKFYAIVKATHPDYNGGKSDPEKELTYREACIAWAVLGDDEKRKRYDETGQFGDSKFEIRHDALELASSCLKDAIINANTMMLSRTNVISGARQSLQRHVRREADTVETESAKVEFLNSIKHRAQVELPPNYKGPEPPNLISEIIRQMIEEAEGKVKTSKRRLEVLDLAMEVLETQRWKVDLYDNPFNPENPKFIGMSPREITFRPGKGIQY